MADSLMAELFRYERAFLDSLPPAEERKVLMQIDQAREEDAFMHPDVGRSRRYDARAHRRRRERAFTRELSDGYW